MPIELFNILVKVCRESRRNHYEYYFTQIDGAWNIIWCSCAITKVIGDNEADIRRNI